MDVSKYDEYIPEKELNINFKIPRKRTAEDSFGGQDVHAYVEYYTQSGQFGDRNVSQAQARYEQARAAAYAYANLSGAASQASMYTNSKPPVQFGSQMRPKLDSPIQPPLPPPDNSNRNWIGSSNRSWGSGNQGSYNQNFNSLNSTGNRNSGELSNRSWGLGNSNSRDLDDPITNRGWGSKTSSFSNSGGNRWTSGDNDNFSSGSSQFSGGRGIGQRQFGGDSAGRWGGNNISGRSQDVDRGFGKQQSSWNQKGYRNDDYDNEQGFDSNVSGEFGNRGGSNQNWSNNKKGGFRGGRGGTFSGKQGSFGPYKKKEKPKNVDFTPSVKLPDVTDETLPKDLRLMFQPLYCKLCALQMNSNIMAKLHYSSKNHEKKIRKYLVEHAEKTGEPLHPRATVSATPAPKEKEEDKDPKHFHCDVCDLPLTGKQHAESHYMGKNHNAVLMGKRPSGKGYYDKDGKWVRVQTEKKLVVAEGEDTFGMSFRKSGEDDTAAEKPASGEFTCSICSVSCTSQDQITMHFNGTKHKKKLKLMGISPENFEPSKTAEGEAGSSTPTAEQQQSNFQMDPIEQDEVERNDYSKYKTPSGHYYCGKCNLTVNSEIQLKQHLISKNHFKKVAAKKTEST